MLHALGLEMIVICTFGRIISKQFNSDYNLSISDWKWEMFIYNRAIVVEYDKPRWRSTWDGWDNFKLMSTYQADMNAF